MSKRSLVHKYSAGGALYAQNSIVRTARWLCWNNTRKKKHYSPTCENRQPKQKATVLVSATHQWNTVYTQPTNERTNNNNNTTAVWRNERLQSLLPYLSSIAFTLTYEHWIIRMAKKELPMRKSGNTLTKLWLIYVHCSTYYMVFYKQGHNSLFENKYRYFLYLFWYFSTYLQRKFGIKTKSWSIFWRNVNDNKKTVFLTLESWFLWLIFFLIIQGGNWYRKYWIIITSSKITKQFYKYRNPSRYTEYCQQHRTDISILLNFFRST